MARARNFQIEHLGECKFDSPLLGTVSDDPKTPDFVDDKADRVLVEDRVGDAGDLSWANTMEMAGPRRKIFFDPASTRIGIVSCGGLCPGINDVIRGLVHTAKLNYGVKTTLGFRYGYRGLVPEYGHEPIDLTLDVVEGIHEKGGSILASSRGEQCVKTMVDRLQALGISILFVIGGDGTQRGGQRIAQEAQDRGAPIAVIGIPKTIDNDILFIDRSFGYETAFSQAVESICVAHDEAKGTLNGVGLVKLMGRHSGFITAHSAIASGHVNFCLIPEMPFGDNAREAFRKALGERLRRRQHAVIVVAEGFGQEYMSADESNKDLSGNVKLGDIGVFMASRIKAWLKEEFGDAASVKYVDPSYVLRGVPASATDSAFCLQLAQDAVHAAMSGRTEMIVGLWHSHGVHVPTAMAVSDRKVVDLTGQLWRNVLSATGQSAVIGE